jgi:hypothetical protein
VSYVIAGTALAAVAIALAGLLGAFTSASAQPLTFALTSQDAAVAAAGASAATGGASQDKSVLARTALTVMKAREAAAARVYTVRAGDSASAIAARYCGASRDWTGIYAASRARGWTAWNANDLTAGQHLYLACAYVPGMLDRAPLPKRAPAVQLAAHVSAAARSSHRSENPAAYHGGVFSYTGLEALWESAGGSRSTAAVAACIAEHESGGNPAAISPTDDWGLWQIHAGGYAMLNPYANVRRAVAMSSDGTNWNPWSTKYDCV